MRKKDVLFLLLIVGNPSKIVAQVSDFASNSREINSSSVSEIEITTGLLSSTEYSNYLNDFAHTKKIKGKGIETDYYLGLKDTFFVRNILNQEEWFEREATLISLIDNFAIWLDSDIHLELSENPVFDQFQKGLLHYLSISTDPNSVDPTLGIIELMERYVGAYPNYDGDGVTDILYLNIIDKFESSGQYVAGFFDPINISSFAFSNRRDMVYLDIYPTLIENDSLLLRRSMSTLAHELQHLIHAGYEGEEKEEVFVNEGFSEAVEILCGFEPRNPEPYLSNTSKPLLSWNFSNPVSDYARASLWTQYLIEQYGTSILNNLIQNNEVGIKGYDESIREISDARFHNTFQNWGIALAVNDLSISDKYGFHHPQLRNISMPASGASSALPNVISGFIPPNSHSLVALPYVRKLQVDKGLNHDPAISLTSLIHYPETKIENVIPLSNSTGTIYANTYDFGSISILISTPSVENDSLDGSLNLFIDGERSSSARTIKYGDGVNDTFYSNASFLSLSNLEQKIGLIIPKQSSGYWLKSVTLSAVFDSELVGNSDLLSKEKDFLISVYRIKESKIEEPILSNLLMISKRESGKLITEQFSLEGFYRTLSGIEDSIAVIIENDPDDDNFISVGLDFSESDNGMIYNNATWEALNDINIGGNALTGFTPNLSINIVEIGHQLMEENLIRSIEYDYSKVLVEVDSPIGFEASNVNLIALLPDGTYQKYIPINDESDTESYIFEVPVQVNGSYNFKSIFQSIDNATTLTDEVNWFIDIPNGFELSQNYPNPFNPTTTIPFILLERADVGWEVFDVLGRSILKKDQQLLQSGEHTLFLDLQQQSSGIYFVRAVISRARTGKKYTKPIKILMIK